MEVDLLPFQIDTLHLFYVLVVVLFEPVSGRNYVATITKWDTFFFFSKEKLRDYLWFSTAH